jgi:class 3 adenylate cyclase/HAMP domain-containing protein
VKLPSWFLNTSIGSRLGWGFAVLVGLTLVYGGVTLRQMRDLEGQASLLFRHPFTVTRAVAEVELQVLKIHREMKDLAHTLVAEDIPQYLARVDGYEQEALRQLDVVRQRFLGDLDEVKRVHDALLAWRPIREEVGRLRMQGQFSAADAITRGRGAAHVALLERELGGLKHFARGKAAESISRSNAILEDAVTAALLLLAGAALLGTIVAVTITRSIRTPLVHLDRAVAQMAEGELEQQVPVGSEDDLGRLSRSFNTMATSIKEQTEEIERKNEENEGLLLNILPGPIADRLKAGEEPIADYFPEVTVLFSDIVGFTHLSSELPPGELVQLLDEIFSSFDESARRLGIEKIKTIGDAYMAAAGLTREVEDHVSSMVEMGLEMLGAVDRINRERGTNFQVRIGINCGPVVAGVIGKSKFIYDLWGDAVNLASRMESLGISGRIQITEEVRQRIGDRFRVQARGEIEVKGKGRVRTYLIADADSDLGNGQPTRAAAPKPSHS